MICCLCNESEWIDNRDTAYFFNVQLVEEVHRGLNSELTQLSDMIILVRSYQTLIKHLNDTIMHVHRRCGHCRACGKSISCDVSQNTNILNDVINYYSGLNDQQYSILNKLTGCIDEMIAIDEMIGMEEIKGEFVRLLKFLSSISPEELHRNSFLMHIVIMGPPGHGKTEIAKLLGNAFQKSGLLTSNKFVVATRSNLIGAYCGHTARETTKMFDSARGGVIFIDEVYSLGNTEKRDVFTGECIDTINQLLSERTDTLCMIAGYEEEITTRFFNYNAGLERRFPWRFRIKRYTEADLVAIFKKKINDIGHHIQDDALLPKDLDGDAFPNAGGDIVNLVTNTLLSYYDNCFLQCQTGRAINRLDVQGGIRRYLANRKQKVDMAPPPSMYS